MASPVFLRRIACVAALLASSAVVHALSVIPPTFEQLVAASEFVVRGTVTDIHAITVDTPQGQSIQTLVTLHVENVLKGNPGPDVTLTLLGGTVGHRTLAVSGMPKFAVGAREIVFVANNGKAICPLIAAGHGRYHIKHDSAARRDYVARDNNVPLVSTEQIAQSLDGSPANVAASPSAALTVEDFETRIKATAQKYPRPLLLP